MLYNISYYCIYWWYCFLN